MENFVGSKFFNIENLMFFQHKDSGLKAVLAIHDSSLGPTVGGVRCWNYPSEEMLIKDAVKLAEYASLSAALFGCDVGGAKAIIWANPDEKNEAMLRALGIFIQSLGGRFIASPELGTTSKDMDMIGKETQFVAGFLRSSTFENDYSSITARGVYLGIKAATKAVFGSSSLKDRKIAIQGLGKVGTALLEEIIKENPKVIYISDLFFEKVKAVRDKYPQTIMVKPEELLYTDVDILSPCALGQIFDNDSIKKLKCKIIAGAATNQLADDMIADELHKMKILYLPDFLISIGDIVMINADIYGIPQKNCFSIVEDVYSKTEEIIKISKSQNIPPFYIAKQWALDRMAKIRTLKKIYKPIR